MRSRPPVLMAVLTCLALCGLESLAPTRAARAEAGLRFVTRSASVKGVTRDGDICSLDLLRPYYVTREYKGTHYEFSSSPSVTKGVCRVKKDLVAAWTTREGFLPTKAALRGPANRTRISAYLLQKDAEDSLTRDVAPALIDDPSLDRDIETSRAQAYPVQQVFGHGRSTIYKILVPVRLTPEGLKRLSERSGPRDEVRRRQFLKTIATDLPSAVVDGSPVAIDFALVLECTHRDLNFEEWPRVMQGVIDGLPTTSQCGLPSFDVQAGVLCYDGDGVVDPVLMGMDPWRVEPLPRAHERLLSVRRSDTPETSAGALLDALAYLNDPQFGWRSRLRARFALISFAGEVREKTNRATSQLPGHSDVTTVLAELGGLNTLFIQTHDGGEKDSQRAREVPDRIARQTGGQIFKGTTGDPRYDIVRAVLEQLSFSRQAHCVLDGAREQDAGKVGNVVILNEREVDDLSDQVVDRLIGLIGQYADTGRSIVVLEAYITLNYDHLEPALLLTSDEIKKLSQLFKDLRQRKGGGTAVDEIQATLCKAISGTQAPCSAQLKFDYPLLTSLETASHFDAPLQALINEADERFATWLRETGAEKGRQWVWMPARVLGGRTPQ